jgi:hypothetical protein
MSDRRLPRGAVAGVGVVGFLLLVVAARTEGYWQGLLINLGTGALLFVAFEYMIYGTVERLTKLVTEALAGFSAERWTEMRSWAAQVSSDELRVVQRDLQATAPLPTEKLERLQQEIAAVDQMYSDDQMKRISDLYLLADNYGVQSLRQVMAARGEANAG